MTGHSPHLSPRHLLFESEARQVHFPPLCTLEASQLECYFNPLIFLLFIGTCRVINLESFSLSTTHAEDELRRREREFM